MNRRILAALPVLSVLVAVAGACEPSSDDIAQAVVSQFCGSVDLTDVERQLVGKMGASSCVAGFVQSQTYTICNRPPGSGRAASWVCDQCDGKVGPPCHTAATAKVKTTVSVNSHGYDVEVSLETDFSATLEFEHENANVAPRDPPPEDRSQEAFDYVSNTAVGAIAKKSRVAGSIGYKIAGGSAGSANVNVEVECGLSAKRGFYKTTHHDPVPACVPKPKPCVEDPMNPGLVATCVEVTE